MIRKKVLVMLLAVACIIGAVGSAGAVSSYVTSFSSTYPGSATASFSCSICHSNTPTRNSYGTAYANAGHNFNTIEAQDSDGDGATNITEINAGTNPGDPGSKPPPAPAACTGYTYSAWSTCGSNGQQTRTVLSYTPAGCAGTPSTPPVLSQACTPPPVACTGYSYSAWSACGSNGQQTRTVLSNTPAGCAGTPSTPPVLSQACSTGPVACTGYSYSAWSACGSNGQQTRTVLSNTPAGCTGAPLTAPVLTQVCSPGTGACTGYTYSKWSACGADGQQTRTVVDKTPTGCKGKPSTQAKLTRACTPPSLACKGYKYTGWSTCGPDSQQIRSVSHNLPVGCSGTPSKPAKLTKACTPPIPPTPPTTEGTTLYMQRCSACHGSIERSQVRGATAAAIKSAISGFSQMNFLSSLTDAQIQAIANALVTTTPPPPPPPPSGGPHPDGWLNQHPAFVDRNGTSSCTACHGQDLQGGIGPSCYSCHSDGGD